jgi:hypothetical protein
MQPSIPRTLSVFCTSWWLWRSVFKRGAVLNISDIVFILAKLLMKIEVTASSLVHAIRDRGLHAVMVGF